MGKNDKKDGKKKGGKKKKKNQKDNGLIYMRETMIEIQIASKEKLLEDSQAVLREYQEKSKVLKERNKKLKAEQLLHMKELVKQSKEREMNLNKVEEVGYEVVEQAFQNKLNAAREEEQVIEEMIEEIRKLNESIQLTQAEADHCREYKEYGQHEHKKQIELLLRELDDMQIKYEEMACHAQKNFETEKSDLQNETDVKLNKQKDIATENALQSMDEVNHIEIKDNQWMKKEISLYRKDYESLAKTVEELEKENLNVMEELFDSKAADLRISKKFYLNFGESETLDDPRNDPYVYGLTDEDKLEAALDKLRLAKEDNNTEMGKKQPHTHRKMHQFDSNLDSQLVRISDFLGDADKSDNANSDEEFEDIVDSSELDLDDNNESQEDPFFGLEDEDFEDYLRLGPMELKLLSVIGINKPIHKVTIDPNDESRPEEDLSLSASWPVSHRMLKIVNDSTSRAS